MSAEQSPSRIPIPALELPRTDTNDFTSAVMPTNPNYVEGIPPDRGQAALRQMSDVESTTIPVALRANDIRGKEVIFYEITATSFSHVWTVYKRFSDFYDFHTVCKEQLCVEHENFLRLPELPSRLPTRTDSGIEARRHQLADYLSQFLTRAQELERRIRLDSTVDSSANRNRAEGRLAALTHHLVSFLRNNSPLFLMVEQGPAPGLDLSAPNTQRGFTPAPALPIKEGDDIPPVRITRYGDKAFVATLHVPGVATKDLYVVMNAEQPRHMIIGGRWNNFTAASSITQTIESLVKSHIGDEAAEIDRPEIYYDTLPVGDFEVTFEVPEPFVPAVWFSDMRDGVFHVVWSTVL